MNSLVIIIIINIFNILFAHGAQPAKHQVSNINRTAVPRLMRKPANSRPLIWITSSGKVGISTQLLRKSHHLHVWLYDSITLVSWEDVCVCA
ncbi:hypothetical protein LEMLEM_LOCUS15929 [Lemmus lemmus]